MASSPKNNYLFFTARERRGTLLLMLLVLLLCLTPFVLPWLMPKTMFRDKTIAEANASLTMKQARENKERKKQIPQDAAELRPYDMPDYNRYSSYSASAKGTLFYFDPNHLDEAGWLRLGLRPRQVATILKYVQKGGRFKAPDDIKKIWSLSEADAVRLIPYIKIEAREQASVLPYREQPSAPKYITAKTVMPVMINDADTTAWIALPGIGSRLATRIVNFREKLGGFYSIEQVAETWGLPDSTYQKIKPLLQFSGQVKKININTADVQALKQHPYIKYHLANAIVQYRQQHGSFSQTADLKKIMIVDEATYQKLMPYIRTE